MDCDDVNKLPGVHRYPNDLRVLVQRWMPMWRTGVIEQAFGDRSAEAELALKVNIPPGLFGTEEMFDAVEVALEARRALRRGTPGGSDRLPLLTGEARRFDVGGTPHLMAGWAARVRAHHYALQPFDEQGSLLPPVAILEAGPLHAAMAGAAVAALESGGVFGEKHTETPLDELLAVGRSRRIRTMQDEALLRRRDDLVAREAALLLALDEEDLDTSVRVAHYQELAECVRAQAAVDASLTSLVPLPREAVVGSTGEAIARILAGFAAVNRPVPAAVSDAVVHLFHGLTWTVGPLMCEFEFQLLLPTERGWFPFGPIRGSLVNRRNRSLGQQTQERRRSEQLRHLMSSDVTYMDLTSDLRENSVEWQRHLAKLLLVRIVAAVADCGHEEAASMLEKGRYARLRTGVPRLIQHPVLEARQAIWSRATGAQFHLDQAFVDLLWDTYAENPSGMKPLMAKGRQAAVAIDFLRSQGGVACRLALTEHLAQVDFKPDCVRKLLDKGTVVAVRDDCRCGKPTCDRCLVSLVPCPHPHEDGDPAFADSFVRLEEVPGDILCRVCRRSPLSEVVFPAGYVDLGREQFDEWRRTHLANQPNWNGSTDPHMANSGRWRDRADVVGVAYKRVGPISDKAKEELAAREVTLARISLIQAGAPLSIGYLDPAAPLTCMDCPSDLVRRRARAIGIDIPARGDIGVQDRLRVITREVELYPSGPEPLRIAIQALESGTGAEWRRRAAACGIPASTRGPVSPRDRLAVCIAEARIGAPRLSG